MATGILAGSCRDPGQNPGGIAARFCRRDFESQQVSRRESRRDSWQEANFPAAKILAWFLPRIAAGWWIPGDQNLSGISAWFSPRIAAWRWIPHGQNLGGISAWFSPRIAVGLWIPGGQNLGRILVWFSPRIAVGRWIPSGQNLAGSWRDSCQESWRDDEFPAAKILVGSQRDSRQELQRDKTRYSRWPKRSVILAKNVAVKQNSRRPKSRRDLVKILPRITGRR